MYLYFASSLVSRSLQRDDVGGLKTLGALLDIELDALALFKSLEPLHQDGSMVDEHVLTHIAGDETIPLGVTEPLDRSCLFFFHFLYSFYSLREICRRSGGCWRRQV